MVCKMKQRHFQFSLLTGMFGIAVVAVAFYCWHQLQLNTDFKIVVSGALVDELPRDTTLTFWRISQTSDEPIVRSVSELPFRLPYDQLSGKTWNVSFASKSLGMSPLFTIELSHDLFDSPRKVNIKLDSPVPQLRPIMDDWTYIRYTPNISQRMHYRDLPRWDPSGTRLTNTPSIPVLKVVNETTGVDIHEAPMIEGCWGSQWFARLKRVPEIADGQILKYTVNYPSGGSFGEIVTEFRLIFNKARHR